MNPSVKLRLHQHCLAFVEQRITNIRELLENATESANDETKSSAGDKHETGRAMAQLEQEKGAKQLNEALYLKNELLKIDPVQLSKIVSKGSLVITDAGNFYISIAAGKAVINDIVYFAISPESPLALKLLGLSAGDSAEFNQKKYRIREIK